MRNLFEGDFDIKRILDALSAASHQTITPGETLIFFDEIQEAKNGITALKYFMENAPEHHVVAAGSLLGLELHSQTSFPVGKVQFLNLYPMSFMEFLDALGEEPLSKVITGQNWTNINLFSSRLKELLKQYYFVGGMPEAVLSFSESRDWKEVREIQNDILESYDRDFSKHAPADIVPRIRQLWQRRMVNRITKESMEFIAGEIIDAVLASDSLEDGINSIQEILESNGIVEVITD